MSFKLSILGVAAAATLLVSVPAAASTLQSGSPSLQPSWWGRSLQACWARHSDCV